MSDHALRPLADNPTVDFSAEGVQHGFLRLPYSRDDSALGFGDDPDLRDPPTGRGRRPF
jgi:hypothetical protein